MQSLMLQERGLWPQINAVSKLDLVAADINKGPWAMALTPMLFCKKFKLLDVSIHKKMGLGRLCDEYSIVCCLPPDNYQVTNF